MLIHWRITCKKGQRNKWDQKKGKRRK